MIGVSSCCMRVASWRVERDRHLGRPNAFTPSRAIPENRKALYVIEFYGNSEAMNCGHRLHGICTATGAHLRKPSTQSQGKTDNNLLVYVTIDWICTA